MNIGLDFDNTIVSYDGVFHKAALDRSLIPVELPTDKTAVRDYLRAQDQEAAWTALQGEVYGARMQEAALFDGVTDFLSWARAAGHRVSIVSHKTERPFAGPAYDLHKAARDFIAARLGAALAPENIFFEVTKDAKWARIGALECNAFVDDLPEILLSAAMPVGTRRILFDPDNRHGDDQGDSQALVRVSRWADLPGALSP